MHAAQQKTAVITGMGCVCAAGSTARNVLAAMDKVPALSSHELLGGNATPFPFFAVNEKFFPGGRRFSALDTLALARHAAEAALTQAALSEDAQRRMLVLVGTTAGSALHFLRDYNASRGNGAAWPPPLPPALNAHSDRDDYLAGNVALALIPQSQGSRLTLTNACTSGADAVGLGLAAIRQGACCALCGGVDALSLVPHSGFARLMIYSDEPCRPFDRQRKGLNLGEGAAMLVLEDEAHATGRGARILGRVLGYGAAADAHHFTAPHPQGRGLKRAVEQALRQGRIIAADLAFINAHGTATLENDKVEGRTLVDLAQDIPVWASKGATGHTLGAAGALEAVLTVQALRQGLIPASPGFTTKDPDIGLSPTTFSLPLSPNVNTGLSTSLGFGGGNTALLLQGERI